MLGELLVAETRPAGLKPFEPDRETGGGKRKFKKYRPLMRLFLLERTMQIHLNGELRDISAKTVLGLLDSLDINPKRVAVELNMEILPKAEYTEKTIADGDRIEIVHFVGGG
jgi:sulfur carrier protein